MVCASAKGELCAACLPRTSLKHNKKHVYVLLKIWGAGKAEAIMEGSSADDTPHEERKAALYNEASFIHADIGADASTDKKLTADAIEVCHSCLC